MASRFAPPAAFTKSVLGAHTWLGLVFGALIYLVCVSGTLSVLLDEFKLWEAPNAPRVEKASPALLARVAQTVFPIAQAEGLDHDLFITAPTPELPWLRVFAQGPHDGPGPQRQREWLADADGQLHPHAPAHWSQFLRDHHYRLHLPAPWGAYTVGIIGTLLLASLISGVLAHRRILRDAFRLRWGGSRRLSNADLHNRIGVWALPFHLIVSLTGSLLGLAGLIIGVLAFVAYGGDQDKAIAALLGPQPTGNHAPAPLPDIAPMVQYILGQVPGAEPTMVIYQDAGTAGQVVRITTAEPRHLARNEGWAFDGEGRLLEKAGFTDGTVGMRIYGMITPLHFGTYGGIGLKLIYAVLGTGLTVVVAAGISMWLARQRERGRPAPRTEKAWAALVWGQILAYAVPSLVALGYVAAGQAAPVALLLGVYWALTLGLCALAPWAPDDRTVARHLRAAGGLALVAVAVWHGSTWPGQPVTGILIDLALLAGAAALLWPALRARWRAAPSLSI